WNEEGTVTSSSRSGIVRFRVTSSTADLDFKWFAIFPSTVSVEAFGSLTISGTLTNDQSRLHRFTMDFGANATSYMFQLAEGTVNLSGMGSFTVALVDLNTLATSGSDPGIYGNIDEAANTPVH